MNEVQMCAICLVTDVKMFDVTKNVQYTLLGTRTRSNLGSALQRMIGVRSNEHRNRFLCFECATLLKKFDEFQYKCHQAQKIFIQYHEHAEQNSKSKAESNRSDKVLIECRERLLSHLKISLNVAVTSIPPSTSEVSEVLVLDVTKTESSKCKQDINCDMENEHWLPFELDADSSELPSYNESPEKCITLKTKKKIKPSNRAKRESLNFDDADNEPLSKISKNTSETKAPRKSGPKFNESCFENFITVTLLTPEAAKKEVELRKETSNYKNCPLKCDLCYRAFEVQKAYDNHMKRHSSEFGDKECEYCHLRFIVLKDLSKHKFTCHRRKFSCNICSYVCFCTTQAKLHMNLHKGIKYTCEQCGETFSMPNTLFMHKRIKHPTECVCALCGSTFATQRGLQSHNLLMHRQETNHQNGPSCEQCNIHFSSETAWKRHLVLSAKHEVSHGCEACGESFEDDEALKTHAKTHSRKQRARIDVRLPGPCPLCEKWLDDRPGYKQHTMSEHPDSGAAKRIQADDSLPCVCEVCGKRFKKPCFLVYHQRQHTGERPYACPTCGSRFASASALGAHRRLHRGPTPLGCRLCRALFRSKSALNKHVKNKPRRR